MQKKAIDISAWQGNPDFNKIKASGIEQIILRSGCGKNADKSFARSAAECERLGIPFGSYHFIYAINEAESEQNAITCANILNGKQLSLPVFADMEYDSESYYVKRTGKALTKDVASRIVKKFLETMKAMGYKAGNYTNLDWRRRFFTDEINNGYDQWIAMWGTATSLTNAAPIWQYSSKGKVPGITGNVDMDYVHKDYVNQPVNPPVPVVPVDPDSKVHKIPTCYATIFDPEWYLFTYKDLQKWITDCIRDGVIGGSQDEINWQLYCHFLSCGMEEADNGRHGCKSFDVKKYKAAMTDLQQIYGDVSYKPYYNHYMLTGAQEIADGKRINVDLSV